MYPTTLKPLLADPAFAPGQVRDAADRCDLWFAHAADVPSFVFRSIFRDLIERDFTDSQGVPVAEWERFVADVLPKMLSVLNALPADPVAELRDLVLAYHSSI